MTTNCIESHTWLTTPLRDSLGPLNSNGEESIEISTIGIFLFYFYLQNPK